MLLARYSQVLNGRSNGSAHRKDVELIRTYTALHSCRDSLWISKIQPVKPRISNGESDADGCVENILPIWYGVLSLIGIMPLELRH